MNEEVVIIDFETTGVSPAYCRIIEVGAAVVNQTGIVDRYSQLMNPGTLIPSFISELTGITNSMVRGMPRPEKVMPELAEFIGNRALVAHNASFDSRFLKAEMDFAGIDLKPQFLCTLRLARRLIPGLSDYKLGTIAAHLGIESRYRTNAHRAMHDVEITAEVWRYLQEQVNRLCPIGYADLNILQAVMKKSKKAVPGFLEKLGARATCG